MADHESADVQPLLEALDQAHEAQTRFDVAKQLRAEGKDANVRAEKIRFQQFVIGLFKRLRPYLVVDLPEYYEHATVWENDEHDITGLKCLHLYQGAVREEAGFDGEDVYQDEEAVLMPDAALRNALDLLSECLYKLGFAPQSNKRRKAYNASVSEDDDIDPGHIFKDEQEPTESTGD
jgi:hypothetical protein